ncbi:phospholipase [Helicobacter didelphidarum]|uniref:Phosphatidylcholine 1-acylhydrolase n=2 Tax=Helicobacter didelphidarum TaxID=2040648 RepID=A0A3D8IL38_9HELI|nr:phospholipase [Helicobacter didelphidarum]
MESIKPKDDKISAEQTQTMPIGAAINTNQENFKDTKRKKKFPKKLPQFMEIDEETQKEYDNIKLPPTASKNLDKKALPMSFRFYEPWYFMPAYYSFSPMYDDGHLTRVEIKSQVSSRLDLLSDVICQYCTFSFDLTFKIYLQSYNGKESSPLRDFDLSPALSFYYKRPLAIAGGKGGYITWLGIGYIHVSNGEKENINEFDIRNNTAQWQEKKNRVRSKSYDRIFIETNYRYKDFNARLRAWVTPPIVAFDGVETNGDIWKYMGYGDLRLSYVYKNNLFELYINNIFNNYFTKDYWTQWKGQVELGYSYGITKQLAIYLQYLYGHGDSLYEYSLPVNRIGIGLRLRDF